MPTTTPPSLKLSDLPERRGTSYPPPFDKPCLARSNRSETPLAPGSVAGFPAGTGNGHHIVNNSGAVARLIVVGSRKKEDDCYYSDIDMQLLQHAGGGVFAHKNGEPY